MMENSGKVFSSQSSLRLFSLRSNRRFTCYGKAAKFLQSIFTVRMSFEDFARNFTQLDLVHVGPDDWMLESALHSKQPWRAVLARRRWRSGYNAGGGPTYTGIYRKHKN